MGETSLWDRVKGWLRHPVSLTAATIAAAYCERNGLVMDFAPADEE